MVLLRLRSAYRKRLALFIATVVASVVCVAFLLPRNSDAALFQKAKTDKTQKQLDYVPGEIIVRFRNSKLVPPPSAPLSGRSQLILEQDNEQIAVTIEPLGRGPEIVEGLRLARVSEEETLRAIKALRARPDVMYAEPNFVRRKSIVPNDQRYPSLWALKNSGQLGGTPGVDIKAEQSWEVTTGSRSIVVGVVDEGIDIQHPDLADNIWNNPAEIPGNGLDDDQNGFIDDVNGWDFRHDDNTVFDYTLPSYPPPQDYTQDIDDHGTHVAGTIGAVGNNGIGSVGVNWQVSLMSLKFLGREEGTTADLLQALSYAKMMRDLWTTSGGTKGANIRVLNNSYGGGGFSQAEFDAINALATSNVLFVASAGNLHLNNDLIPHYPASYPSENVIAVGATDRRDGIAPFTNFGPAVELSAPGVEILSTTPRDTYFFASGTSMASPHVAGAAALLYVTNPTTSIAAMRSALMFNGAQIDNQHSLSGKRLSLFGAQQALAENDTTPPAQIADLHIGFQASRTVRLEWTAPGDDGMVGRASFYEIRFSDTPVTDPAAFDQARTILRMFPNAPGTPEFVAVKIPYRHVSGFFGIRTLDNLGNKSPVASVAVANDPNFSDPYTFVVGSPSALSTGGTPLNLIADDAFKSFQLPFTFNYFHEQITHVEISTNGAIRFNKTVENSQPVGSFPGEFVSIKNFHQNYVIAGIWEDLRTDRRPGDDVYVVPPDTAHPDRVIFRWQAVTFDTPIGPSVTRGEHPVNFEIELNRDGTIVNRYGDGNQNLFPVVGISAGFDGYLIESHTSESSLKNLTNAPAITYQLRLPPAPDLRFTSFQANPSVVRGEQLVYSAVITNNGPSPAPNTVLNVTLSPGQNFVSCSGAGTCQASGSSVQVSLGTLPSRTQVEAFVSVEVTALAGSGISATAVLSCSRPDVTPSTLGVSTSVIADLAMTTPFTGAVKVDTCSQCVNTTALRQGTVWGWGHSATGDGSNGRRIYAVQARDLLRITAIAAGDHFALALRDDGTVWAWGINDWGQLGTGAGNLFESGVPLRIEGLDSVVAISAGSGHAAALKNNGTVWTWGSNSSGQLGLGTQDFLKHPVPQMVAGLPPISRLFVGDRYVFAFELNGTSWAWGTNFRGQLADGTTTDRTTPVTTLLPTTVNTISGGGGHVLALMNDSTVLSWGFNLWGQLGNGSNDANAHPTPMQIPGLQATDVAAGSGHSMILKADGTVWTFGLNDFGQLGNGTADIGNNFPKPPHPNPTQVPGLNNVTDIKAGRTFSVAFVNGGDDTQIKTWGENTFGTLGDNSLTLRVSPVLVVEEVTVAKPVFDKASGFVSFPLSVTIACGTPGATIRYTTNGADPTESDATVASGSTVVLSAQSTLKARAFKSGFPPSAINTAVFTGTIGATTLELSQSSFSVGEGAGSLSVTVLRTGDTAGSSLVDISTNDNDTFTFGCADAAGAAGKAFARCDFATSVDTFSFNPGETSKTLLIPIIDDSFVEGNETFQLTLSNPSGATFGSSSTATITIMDNDAVAGANPIFTTPFFVRQHYLDFLAREPEVGEPWSGVLNNCPDVNNNPACDRITVSGAFFGSPEFQLKGYFVYRFYKLAFNRLPLYSEIVVDMRAVTGQTPAEVFQKKATFTNNFLLRTEFANLYNSQTNTGYVFTLMDRYNLGSITTPDPAAPDGPNKLALSSADLINGLSAGTLTRAQVLRAIADSDQVFQREFNQAFVAMQYYGYLRRTPDVPGFNAWLTFLNANPTQSRTMVNGFMNSVEYRLRFGPQPFGVQMFTQPAHLK